MYEISYFLNIDTHFNGIFENSGHVKVCKACTENH